MPRRDPFQFRRERLLESIDTLMRFREMGYEEFVSGDWRNVPAARAELLAVGDNMHPASGHASREMGREFYGLRQMLAHEYFHVGPERLWRAIEKLPQLREEVLARTQAPEKSNADAPPRSDTDQGR